MRSRGPSSSGQVRDRQDTRRSIRTEVRFGSKDSEPAHHQQIGREVATPVAPRSLSLPLTQKVQKVRKSVIWHRGSIYHLFEALEGNCRVAARF